MWIKPYLVVSKSGRCRVTKTQPALAFDEISIQLEIRVPDALFQKPSLSASIVVDPKSVQPLTIAAQVIDNIEDQIKQHTGLELSLKVVNQETEDNKPEEE